MNKESLTNLKQTLKRNKEFTTLDVIEQLEQQIEKMENCANCDHWFDMDSTCELHKEEIPVFMIDCGCKDWECAYKEEEE